MTALARLTVTLVCAHRSLAQWCNVAATTRAHGRRRVALATGQMRRLVLVVLVVTWWGRPSPP
jgi:hypothetical protein